MENFTEKPKENKLKNILTLLIIIGVSISVLYVIYQNKVIQKANQALESLAATTISTNISTDGTLTVGGSATTSGSYYIGNDLTVMDGNLGIGTTSPSQKLTLHGNILLSSTSTVIKEIYTASSTSYLSFYAGTVQNASPRIDINGINSANSPADIIIISGDNTAGSDGHIRMGADRGSFAEYMRITKDGNVGISTTTPGASLSITASAGSLTGNDLLFQVASTTNSTFNGNLAVTADGNVGIGTTTPVSPLHIKMLTTNDVAGMRFGLNLPQNEGGTEYRWSGLNLVTNGSSPTGSSASDTGWWVQAWNDLKPSVTHKEPGSFLIGRWDGSSYLFPLTLSGDGDVWMENNVGINTTTPDAVLSVTASAGSLTGDQMLFTVASTTNSTSNDYLTVTADGNVGIGTVNPWEILTIANDGDADFDISVAQNSNPSNSPSQHFRLSDGTHAVPLIVPADEEIGKIEWEYYDGTAFRDGASINVVVDGTPAAGSSPAYFQFKTTPSGSTASVERMRITSGGNVGVGTTTPNALFSVASSTATTTVFFDSGATTKGACFKLKDNDGGGYTYCSVNDGTMSCSTDSCE